MAVRFSNVAPALAVILISGGCIRPAVAPKPLAFQESENTVRDWNTVATRIADEMSKRGLLSSPASSETSAISGAPTSGLFFVNVLAPGSTFLHEVRGALQSEILARGGRVSRSPANATVVNLDINVVHWAAQSTLGGTGTLSGLAAGTAILLAQNGPYSPAGGFGMAAGAGIAADAITSMTPHTNVEVVWEASILREGEIVMEIRNPIYIRPRDPALYESLVRVRPVESFANSASSLPVKLQYVQ